MRNFFFTKTLPAYLYLFYPTFFYTKNASKWALDNKISKKSLGVAIIFFVAAYALKYATQILSHLWTAMQQLVNHSIFAAVSIAIFLICASVTYSLGVYLFAKHALKSV